MGKRILAVIMSLSLITGLMSYMSEWDFFVKAEASTDFVYEEDTWSFSDEELIDGERPYLSGFLLDDLRTGRTETELSLLNSVMREPAEDLSYGFAALALLCNAGVWDASDISDSACSLKDIPFPVRQDALTSIINYYNLLQYSDKVQALDREGKAKNASRVISTAAKAETPVLMRIFASSSDSDAKTLLVYGSESGVYKYAGKSYTKRLLAYDPGYSEFNDDGCVYYNDSGEWIHPATGISSVKGGVFGGVTGDTDLINSHGYSMAELPKFMIQRVFAYPDDYDVPLTLMQSGLPYVLGLSMDINLSDSAAMICSLSYPVESYDLGSALPSKCSVHVNDASLIITSVVSAAASGGFRCADNEPIISFLVDIADRDTVRKAAEKYGIELKTDPEYGSYYAFPIYLNTGSLSSYYADEYENNEYPLTMDSEICIIMDERKTTTSTTTTTTTSSTARETTSLSSSATTTVSSASTSGGEATVPSGSYSSTSAVTSTETTPASQTLTTTTTATDASSHTQITSSSATETTPPETTSISTTTTKQVFNWSEDNWSMSHDELLLYYMEEGYGLTEEHSDNLNASLSTAERVRVRDVMEDGWLGAGYGMAVTEILGKSGIFPVSMWEPSASLVYELDLTDPRNLSLISYYQLLQESDAVQQQIAWTSSYMTSKAVLSQLIDTAAKASRGESMVLVCLFGEEFAHSAIAYDVEYGLWSLEGEEYDGRILTADPYMTGFTNEACIYFKSNTLDWCVPYWNMDSADGKSILGLASNSLSMMNYAGYFMGTESYANSHPFVPIIQVQAGQTGFTLKSLNDEEEGVIEDSELKWFSTAASIVTKKRAGLDYLSEGYEITPESSEFSSYQMSYEDCLLNAGADNVQSITMLADGTVSILGDKSAYEISLTAEDALPWERITVSGSDVSIITASLYEEGIMVQGDNLGNISIAAESAEDTQSRRLATGDDYSALYIYREEDGTIGVMSDSDGDGVFEGNPFDSLEHEVFYGDVNMDGGCSMLDLVYLNKGLACLITLNKQQLENADCYNDLSFSASDSTALMHYLIAKINFLPIVPG